MSEKRYVLLDPHPDSIGVAGLMVLISEDFQGYAEIVWWHSNNARDEDRQRFTCRTTGLLQGLFCDLHETRPTATDDLAMHDRLKARVSALVIHDFYRQRIQRAAQLEAAYQWHSYPPGALK